MPTITILSIRPCAAISLVLMLRADLALCILHDDHYVIGQITSGR